VSEDRIAAAVAALVAALRDELRAEAAGPPGPDRLLSVEEAARSLGIGRSAAYAELSAGRLASVKIGRRRLVPAAAIARYVAERAA